MIVRRKALAMILILSAVLLACQVQKPVEHRTINVVFRYDDYAAWSPTDLELGIIDAFRKNEAAITFAVIPFSSAADVLDASHEDVVALPSNKGEILQSGVQERILDVALHGYTHKKTNGQAHEYAEFLGLDYDAQVERLAKGKDFLERVIGAPVTTFVPPSNAYDLNTLRALEALGFATLSASRLGEAREESKLSFLPYSCDLAQLRDAVGAARTSSDSEPLIVVLFHWYDLEDTRYGPRAMTLEELRGLLSWLKSQGDVRILSISQAAELVQDLSTRRFLLTKRNLSLELLLPSRLREEASMTSYREPHGSLKTLLKVIGFYSVISVVGLVISLEIGRFFAGRSALFTKAVAIGGIMVCGTVLIYVLRDLHVGPGGMTVSAGAVGACMGLLLCFRLPKSKQVGDDGRAEAGGARSSPRPQDR